MAAYKVGQRVKKVAAVRPEDYPPGWPAARGTGSKVGAQGVVVDPGFCLMPPGCVAVLFDDGRSPHFSGAWAVYTYQIVPLTDPGCQEFIENMERFARVVPRFTVPVTNTESLPVKER